MAIPQVPFFYRNSHCLFKYFGLENKSEILNVNNMLCLLVLLCALRVTPLLFHRCCFNIHTLTVKPDMGSRFIVVHHHFPRFGFLAHTIRFIRWVLLDCLLRALIVRFRPLVKKLGKEDQLYIELTTFLHSAEKLCVLVYTKNNKKIPYSQHKVNISYLAD